MVSKRHFFRMAAGLIIPFLVAALFLPEPMAREERNLIREEMAVIDSAYKTIIDALVLGDMEMISPALQKVQDARGELEQAVKSGYRISLPKNQTRIEDFSKLDTQFHIDLAELYRAAETKQKKVVKNFVHKLLDACVGCHERFRK